MTIELKKPLFWDNERLEMIDAQALGDSAMSNLHYALRTMVAPGGGNGVVVGGNVAKVAGQMRVKVLAPFGAVTNAGVIVLDAADGDKQIVVGATAGSARYDSIEVGWAAVDDDEQSRFFRNPTTGEKYTTPKDTRTYVRPVFEAVQGTAGALPALADGRIRLASLYLPANTTTNLDSANVILTPVLDARLPRIARASWQWQAGMSGGTFVIGPAQPYATATIFSLPTPARCVTLFQGQVIVAAYAFGDAQPGSIHAPLLVGIQDVTSGEFVARAPIQMEPGSIAAVNLFGLVDGASVGVRSYRLQFATIAASGGESAFITLGLYKNLRGVEYWNRLTAQTIPL